MRKPAQTLCDFCGSEIVGSHPTFTYPLTDAQREALLPRRTAGQAHQMLGLLAWQIGPVAIELDACRDCVDGVMPVIGERVHQRIEALLSAREEHGSLVIIDEEGD